MTKTTQQLIDTYCMKYSIVIKDGDGALFLMPFLTMIAVLDVYNEKIMPMQLKGDAKYVRKMWANEYHKFDRITLYAFDLDQLTDLSELMDGFDAWMARSFEILRDTIWNNLPLSTAKAKNDIIDTLVMNVLTQVANVMWEDTYGVPCKVLTNLENIALRLCDRLVPNLEGSVFYHPDQVELAVKALCVKMADYLEKKLK